MCKANKEIPEGHEECPTCNGKGEAVISCCTGEVVDDDIMMCPTCKEHLGEETCPDCDGKGHVPVEKEDFTDKTLGLGARAEMLRDRLKYGD